MTVSCFFHLQANFEPKEMMEFLNNVLSWIKTEVTEDNPDAVYEITVFGGMRRRQPVVRDPSHGGECLPYTCKPLDCEHAKASRFLPDDYVDYVKETYP